MATFAASSLNSAARSSNWLWKWRRISASCWATSRATSRAVSGAGGGGGCWATSRASSPVSGSCGCGGGRGC